jgi:hypothetical protein
MINSKSNSKKVFLTNTKKVSSGETTIPNYLKRYKSQEVYLVTGKKNTKTTSTPNQTSTNLPGTGIFQSPQSIPAKNMQNTSTSISTNYISTNYMTHTNSSSGKTPTGNKRKTHSPDSANKVSSKINNYLNNKPKQGQKVSTVSKIMQDESIQELDTEENSKI